jgi:ribosomal protein S12 methylthiotransferase accessory factor
LDLLLDPSLGIISKITEIPIEPGAPNFFHYAAWACNTEAFSPQKNFNRSGGASSRREIAVAKAVGEAVERYCAALHDREECPLASFESAPFKCVDPASFALHSPEQYQQPGFPWVPFTSSTSIRWTPARDFLSGETVHVPAAFVWIPYTFAQSAGDSPVGQPISTGLACHSTPDMATLTALYEVVERDCFTIFWQAMISPPQIRIATVSAKILDLVRRFELTGDRVLLFDITLDNGIWCFLSVLVSEAPERPAFVFAASANLNPEYAAIKALEELAHTLQYSQVLMDNRALVSRDNGWEGVRTQKDHLSFAGCHDNRDSFDFMTASQARHSFDEYNNRSADNALEDTMEATRRIELTGHRVLVADVTSSDIASLGLSVCRVLVPGYHPLFIGHANRALGGRRLYEVPQRLGHAGIAPGCRDNPAPHPYP